MPKNPSYRPRNVRIDVRAEAAAQRAWRAAPTLEKELEAAKAKIAASFDNAAAINRFKLRVERATLNICKPDVVLRYGARVAIFREFDLTLDQAIFWVEDWYKSEKYATSREVAIRYGHIRSRLTLEVLRELRLMLRLIRRYGSEHFPGIVSFVLSTLKEILANDGKREKVHPAPAVK